MPLGQLPTPVGVYLCTSTTHPTTGLFPGFRIFETDTGNELTYQSATTGFTPHWNTAWGEIAFAQVTATQGSITAIADLTGLTTGSLTLVGNRKVLITGSVLLSSSVASDQTAVAIADTSSTALQSSTAGNSGAVAARAQGTSIALRLTPAAGTNLWKLRAQRANGTGTVTMTATAAIPAFILVTDIGPNGAPL